MTTRKYPAPFYAAAGAGEYAYQRLRALDIDRIRHTAQTVYADLVARGERVIANRSTTDVAVPPARKRTPAARG